MLKSHAIIAMEKKKTKKKQKIIRKIKKLTRKTQISLNDNELKKIND